MAILTPQRVDARFTSLEQKIEGLVQSVSGLLSHVRVLEASVAALSTPAQDRPRHQPHDEPKPKPNKRRVS